MEDIITYYLMIGAICLPNLNLPHMYNIKIPGVLNYMYLCPDRLVAQL